MLPTEALDMSRMYPGTSVPTIEWVRSLNSNESLPSGDTYSRRLVTNVPSDQGWSVTTRGATRQHYLLNVSSAAVGGVLVGSIHFWNTVGSVWSIDAPVGTN